MGRFSTINKLLIGGVTGGAAAYYLTTKRQEKQQVYSSWTTNYAPSVKWDSNWDHRNPKNLIHPKEISNKKHNENQINEKLESAKAKVRRHIILIRHGQYFSSALTDVEAVLTETGRKQAKTTGARLKELGFPYTQIIKSTMSRAQETGSLISESLPDVPVKNCDMLREGAPVPPEPPVGSWRPEASQFFRDGARIEAAFRRYFHRADPEQEKDSFTIVVCHANVIRYFVCRALQFPPEAWLRLSLNHGSITWVTITPSGNVILRALGDSGHMPIELLTSANV